ncbi:MAG: IMP cyclohydrolase [Sphaerochaeta sp.]|nr:IMP cyclohydrolase [Sphaerochaeta sp.]MDX9914362.1 IMP cyclohydrolase [Sphaerochaeta sp.]
MMGALPPYPGRGIICGTSSDGVRFGAYFLSARSPSSRNRLMAIEDGTVVTKVADPSLAIDPSLLIYTAMQRRGGQLIIANGDHGDTIAAALERSLSLQESLQDSWYEPDGPHYTARISAVAVEEGYTLSILRKRGGVCERVFWNHRWDTAHLIHTYEGDSEVLPTFIGDPRPVEVDRPAQDLAAWVWQLLDERYRLAVAVWTFDEMQQVAIINDYTGGSEEWTTLH